MRADVPRQRRADVEVAVIFWQHVYVVEYETVEVGERARHYETHVHQRRFVENSRLLLKIEFHVIVNVHFAQDANPQCFLLHISRSMPA